MISTVIPTRNRPDSLARTLRSLERQDRLPDEVLIVDASDPPVREDALLGAHPALHIVCHPAPPNVCAQRNLGIRAATGTHVLLLDDDIELPPDYLRRLADYVLAHPDQGAVTGRLRERTPSGGFAESFPEPSLRHLAFAFLFQLTVWGDVEGIGGPAALPRRLLRRWYRHRGNTWTLAGWPLVTQVRSPVVRTAIYGLGAALVRRGWVLDTPYDERLGMHGIGDNYGVAIGFPVERGIQVLTDVVALHHRAGENRLATDEAYYRRVLALDHFTRTSPRFPWWTTAFLTWSLLGNALMFSLRRKGALLRRTLAALIVVVAARNPLGRKLAVADAEPSRERW